MKPKILFVMHMPPPVHGAAMMGQYIHDSKLINEKFECRYINPSASSTVGEVGKMGLRKIWRTIRVALKIIATNIRWKPDLVYFTATCSGSWTSCSMFMNVVYVAAVKLTAKKVVYHLHNKGVEASLKAQPSVKLYYKWLFKNVKVILLAEVLYQDVKKFVKREDVYICPNGIPETLSEEPKAERHNKVPRILFLSNLIVSKGVLVLLDALKILKDKGYSFVCDFVGGETTEIDAARFAEEVEKRGLNQIAVYDGRKYGEDKKEFFEKADVFTFPSFYSNETFGLVNLEAMEHKLPVVSTNEGGIPDVVKDGENGLISEKRNPDSLAQCIAKLLDSKELREKMGEDGYRKFKEYFTLQAFEGNFASCISEITNWGGDS